MKVWIDQELCTGDSLCEEMCPEVFVFADRLSYVKEAGRALNTPGGKAQMAVVPTELEDDVTEAAEECPGECIFVVVD